METPNTLNHDLYLMLGPGFDTLHLRRCNEGDTGFEIFIRGNIGRLQEEAIFPDNWLFHYQFTEAQVRNIKALDTLRSRDYFRKLMPIFLKEKVTPSHIVPLERALELEYRELPLLSSNHEIPITHLRNLLPCDGNIGYELNLVRPPFMAYTAIETCQGVLLFTPTLKGARQFENYMQNLADNFFLPQMPEKEITISKLPAFDPTLRHYADMYPLKKRNALGKNVHCELPPNIFAQKDSLINAIEYLHYDLTPSWRNFCHLIFPTDNFGLHCSQQNYDIMRLLYTAETGRVLFPDMDADTYTYSYIRDFNFLLGKEPSESRARELAGTLLQRDFPEIRERLLRKAESEIPKPEFKEKERRPRMKL